VTKAEAIEQAGAMVDRFHRLMIRTIRTLRDLRRYAPKIVVQNAGLLNDDYISRPTTPIHPGRA
jgi:hypothetical protein